jgi:molybdate transport system substrate-binding protein
LAELRSYCRDIASNVINVVNVRKYLVKKSTCLALAGVILASVPTFAASEDVKQPAAVQLSIVAAADLTFALDHLVRQFEDDYPATKVTVTYGSSGNFFAQLQNGAPFDLFFSAGHGLPAKACRSRFGG